MGYQIYTIYFCKSIVEDDSLAVTKAVTNQSIVEADGVESTESCLRWLSADGQNTTRTDEEQVYNHITLSLRIQWKFTSA